MKIPPWTARFTDKATEAALVATQFVRDRQRLRYLVWGLVVVVAFQVTAELWQSLVDGADVTLTLLVQLIIIGCGGGVIFCIDRIAARAQHIEQRQLFLRTLELESAFSREKEARSQQLRFSALMAHQFRNPLAIIKSQAQVREREASTYPQDAHATQLPRRQRII
ncbi:MAG: HAMP domain-containing histidine kinase [Chromatiaceae bacterium]|nr:HAMP domain-containing histidine kinase [Chromatiaceae bacterium]